MLVNLFNHRRVIHKNEQGQKQTSSRLKNGQKEHRQETINLNQLETHENILSA